MWTEKKSLNQIKKRRNLNLDKIRSILQYATKKYYCRFPENYEKKLYNLMDHLEMIPSTAVIDAIIAEWNIWKPYVDPKSFNEFFQHELESMFKIHAASTFHSECLHGYIGNKATVIKKLPSPKSTTVHWKGAISVDGREAKVFS